MGEKVKPFVILSPETKIFSVSSKVEGLSTIYGKVIRVGGEQPGVRLELLNREKITIHTDEDNAKKLAHKLYTVVGLSGKAEWDINTYDLLDFKLYDIITYEETPITDALTQLSNLAGKYWSDVDDISAEIENIRKG